MKLKINKIKLCNNLKKMYNYYLIINFYKIN